MYIKPDAAGLGQPGREYGELQILQEKRRSVQLSWAKTWQQRRTIIFWEPKECAAQRLFYLCTLDHAIMFNNHFTKQISVLASYLTKSGLACYSR